MWGGVYDDLPSICFECGIDICYKILLPLQNNEGSSLSLEVNNHGWWIHGMNRDQIDYQKVENVGL